MLDLENVKLAFIFERCLAFLFFTTYSSRIRGPKAYVDEILGVKLIEYKQRPLLYKVNGMLIKNIE